MAKPTHKELLDAGVHFGHLKMKWNPNMAPYIFMERNGIHVIDLNKTAAKLDEAAAALKQIARSGKKILFVATKKQAKEAVEKYVKPTNMPYVVERWPGGMLTNFSTIRKAIRKMSAIDKMQTDGTFDNMSKKERLMVMRQREKLERLLGSIADLTRIPSAIFIIDIGKEHIALSEAKKLNIPVFGIVDTNCDPTPIDFVIPGNDDASDSISILLKYVTDAVKEGLSERKAEKDKATEAKKKKEAEKAAEKEAKAKEAGEEEKENPKKPVDKKASETKASKKEAEKTES